MEEEFKIYWETQAPIYENMVGALQNTLREIAYNAWVQSWEQSQESAEELLRWSMS